MKINSNFLSILLITLLLSQNIFSEQTTEQQAKVDDLVNACIQQNKSEPICDFVLTAKQIGDDSIEYIKEYMKLSPTMYTTLTLVNFAAIGRLRIKTKSFLNPKANHIYDIQKNQFFVTYEIKF